jgi:chloramphenicol O-acetyltransferase type A
MKIIDLDTWERIAHYRFFKRMDYPHYNMCFNIDITRFLDTVKARNISFYYAMIFAATRAANDVSEFRYRIRGEQVILHDMVHPSFTDMSKGSDLFKMVTIDMTDSIETFVIRAKEKSEKQKDYFIAEDFAGRDDLIYITCIPWASFTSLSHTISFNKDDSVPRIAWGRYYTEGYRVLLPFSLQAHHSFVDGIHMGRYIDSLQDYLNRFE